MSINNNNNNLNYLIDPTFTDVKKIICVIIRKN